MDKITVVEQHQNGRGEVNHEEHPNKSDDQVEGARPKMSTYVQS